ncbi:MAG: alpha-galactosidase [Prevotella sp.]|nr:alpha-galactosidase [Prevotella sp.]
MKKLLTLALLAVAATASAQRTPTMGWSSWNTFALNINEQLIRQQADAMHTSGLQEAGFKYVNIDDGYWDGRGQDGHLRLNTKLFPSGMRALVDYIHSLGLKAGIYSDAGDNTCGSGNRHAWGIGVGFAGHEEQDCQLYFRDWDFDFIKVDYCGGNHMGLDERTQYTKISNAIRNCGKKDVVFNICRWAYPGTWAADVADSWRTTGDIYDAWRSVKGILAENLYLSAYCHDGHYNDMDMLEVGRSMSKIEDETHFGMWCIMASPLLIGCDMANIKPEALKLLCNRDLIALNQDPLHLQAYVAEKQGECYILVKDLKKLRGKERAVAVYNPSDEEQTVTLNPATVELGGAVQYYDCFLQAPYVYDQNPITLKVPAHGTKIFRAKGKKRLERTTYEAETAFLPMYQEIRNNQAADLKQLLGVEATAVYSQSPTASGGYVARFLGKSEQNDLQWQHVYSKTQGKRRMTIGFFCGEEREMDVIVNGQKVKTLKVNGSDWGRRQTITVDVNLKKGNNVIRLANPRGWMPDIDAMSLSPRFIGAI